MIWHSGWESLFNMPSMYTIIAIFLYRHRCQSFILSNNPSRARTSGSQMPLTQLLKKFLSDADNMGMSIVIKQHYFLTEHTTPFVLSFAPKSHSIMLHWWFRLLLSKSVLKNQLRVSGLQHILKFSK